MTDPLKLAEEIENMDSHGDRAADRRLIAAALRLAQAHTALTDHQDKEPTTLRTGEYSAWADDEAVLIFRVREADAAYRAARGDR